MKFWQAEWGALQLYPKSALTYRCRYMRLVLCGINLTGLSGFWAYASAVRSLKELTVRGNALT